MLIFSTSCNIISEDIEQISDFIEIRLDLLKKSECFIDFKKDKKYIITLRDADEGGNYTGTFNDKWEIMQDYLKFDNIFFDIELKHYLEIPNLYQHRIILSLHNFSDIQTDFIIKSINDLRILNCFFYKFVFKIDTYKELLSINEILKNKFKKYSLISVGKMSFFSRVLYKQLGSFTTYFGKSGHLTAQNQLTDNQVKFYNLKKINKHTKIFGIIGGNQIYNSIGLSYYNNYFTKNNLNSVYIPLVTDDFYDFLSIIEYKNINLYSVSVTMPYKKVISRYLNKDFPINFWNVIDNRAYFTDESAIIKSIEYFKKDNIKSYIIIGSGVLAEEYIKRLNTVNIKIICRNNDRYKQLISQYNLNELLYKKNTCLINASPIGHKDDSVFDYFYIPDFNYAIDLTYSLKTTSLIEYCIKNKMKYIDGKQFWHWQAEKQLEFISRQCLEK